MNVTYQALSTNDCARLLFESLARQSISIFTKILFDQIRAKRSFPFRFWRYFDFSSLQITVINSTRDAQRQFHFKHLMRAAIDIRLLECVDLYQFSRENFSFDCTANARKFETNVHASTSNESSGKSGEHRAQGRISRTFKERFRPRQERRRKKKPLCEWYVRHVISQS